MIFVEFNIPFQPLRSRNRLSVEMKVSFVAYRPVRLDIVQCPHFRKYGEL